MYGFVLYQLSGTIHAGIQYGHSVVEYGLEYNDDIEYQDWARNWKTFWILSGGSSSELEYKLNTLLENGVRISKFNEPDLGNIMTSFVFIVSEYVFNVEKYPNFQFSSDLLNDGIDHETQYNNWVKSIGGRKNAFLRKFLKNTKFA